MIPTPRTVLTWVNFTGDPAAVAAGIFIPFRDIAELRGNYVVGVEYVNSADGLGNFPSGEANLGAPQNALLTLSDQESAVVRDMPCATLDPTLQAGMFKQFHPFRIEMPRSGVRFNDNLDPTELCAGFLFHYFRPEDMQVEPLAASLGMLPPGAKRSAGKPSQK